MMLALLAMLPVGARQWLGGDISMMTSNARNGVIYKDSCGVTVDPYDLFSQQGWNMMRVRLFVDPQYAPGSHHDEGVCQDLDYVIGLCKTIRARGFEVMLDFHVPVRWPTAFTAIPAIACWRSRLPVWSLQRYRWATR